MKKALALAMGIASLSFFAGNTCGAATFATEDVCISLGLLSVATTGQGSVYVKASTGNITKYSWPDH